MGNTKGWQTNPVLDKPLDWDLGRIEVLSWDIRRHYTTHIVEFDDFSLFVSIITRHIRLGGEVVYSPRPNIASQSVGEQKTD